MLASGPSGFYNAPTTKGLLLVVGSLSLLSSIFQIKTDFHLQFTPHLTSHHQFWRLIVSHFAFSTSTELLFGGFIIYHLRIIERLFGPAKYVSFIFVAAVLCTFLNVAVLVTGSALGLNVLPAGPYGVIFAALYQFYILIPVMYEFKVFGVALTDKIFMYILGAQLLFSHIPGSIALSICGLLAGAIYRSDFAGTRRWRFPKPVARFGEHFLLPIFSSSPAIRSTATTFENRSQTRASDRPAQAMREYLDVLSTGGAPQGATPRPPSEEQIATLQAIFPAATQEQAIAALNSANNNLDGAVQYLLDNQSTTQPSTSSS
ncbi:hypothetical protein BX616_006646 [Lobosporangium transversale]|uniref:CUE domain-containing protein n=1 Tax=Lobosporangium transversale TaxID=64571 RepID=A0A1Y2GCV1_9FUNG|nr:hypothetical protein BCR41DRAFT_362727 [Lobosporangium transversale]KAF9915218.1 hypothetical protein BX616_006646 [Lobosporangium transversale]ORZ04397.1 hypothetical protein BCR41DRAFT_362727 [Lobosporangium transversale]|eukprot:XP_021876505.1 hypothetical protein BCR41DRAFT_362727 [Lobosporangium transversale]